MGRPTGSFRRLLEQIELIDNGKGCWTLPFKPERNGYFRVRINGERKLAHVAFYEYWRGPVPEGLIVHHECRTRNCINDNHLKAATYSVNNKESAPYWGKVYYEQTGGLE